MPGISRRLLDLLCVGLAAACGEPDGPTDGGPSGTPTTGFTAGGPCAADDPLVGTLGECGDAFPACGGNPTGTWVVADWCVEPGAVEPTTVTGVLCDNDLWEETPT